MMHVGINILPFWELTIIYGAIWHEYISPLLRDGNFLLVGRCKIYIFSPYERWEFSPRQEMWSIWSLFPLNNAAQIVITVCTWIWYACDSPSYLGYVGIGIGKMGIYWVGMASTLEVWFRIKVFHMKRYLNQSLLFYLKNIDNISTWLLIIKRK